MKPNSLVVGIAGSVLSSLFLSAQADAASFSKIYVFGDSLSDTGNLFNASSALLGSGIPPAPFYNQGRFSNKLVWIDYLSADLGFTVTPTTTLQLPTIFPDSLNFAYGGATSGNDNAFGFPVIPGLTAQVNTLLQAPAVDPAALYILWAGANDYLPGLPLFQPSTTADVPVANLTQAVDNLFQKGARNFLVVNLPDLGKTPLASSLGALGSNQLSQVSRQHNLLLQQGLSTLRQSRPGIQLTSLNVDLLFEDALAGKLGFSNTNAPCLNQVLGSICSNPDEYLFWDDVHPTDAVHRKIADFALAELEADHAASVPEPTLVPGLLTLGAIAAGLGWRRKQQEMRDKIQ